MNNKRCCGGSPDAAEMLQRQQRLLSAASVCLTTVVFLLLRLASCVCVCVCVCACVCACLSVLVLVRVRVRVSFCEMTKVTTGAGPDIEAQSRGWKKNSCGRMQERPMRRAGEERQEGKGNGGMMLTRRRVKRRQIRAYSRGRCASGWPKSLLQCFS